MALGSELATVVHLKETALRMGSFAIDISLATKPQSHCKPVNKGGSQPFATITADLSEWTKLNTRFFSMEKTFSLYF